MSQTRGTLFGVSIGPGDPELITLKAKKIIESCGVIAVPRTRGENTMALDIVSQIIPLDQKQILHLDFLMSHDAAATDAQHQENARKLIDILETGRDVALLSIGDISIYSTFSYIAEYVSQAGFAVERIAGVPSFCACAAAAGIGLTTADQPLTIIPGSCSEIKTALKLAGSKVLMKAGKRIPQISSMIEEAELAEKAIAVSDCGLPTQKVFSSLKDVGDERYFLTILIPDPTQQKER